LLEWWIDGADSRRSGNSIIHQSITPPHHSEIGGSPRCCPVLCGLRDRCITAMLATQSRHEGGVEPPQLGLWGPGRHRDFASREMGPLISANRR
jgi:hypothetical protein